MINMKLTQKLSKKHGWGKKKISLTKSGAFIKKRHLSKKAKAKLSINKKYKALRGRVV